MGSGRLDVRRLLALGPGRNLEAHALTCLERLEPAHADRREMREQIFPFLVRRNETVTLGFVEPLDRTSCHCCFLSKIEDAGFNPLRSPHAFGLGCLGCKTAYGLT